MRIHTTLTATQLHNIVDALITAGKVNPTLQARIATHGSKSHDFGHEVVLITADKREGEKRRQANAYGHPFGSNGEFGGTYAEWGWFIAAVFDADPYATMRAYVDRYMFDERTEYAFDEDMVHLRIPAGDMLPGDVLVGDNIQGSGVKPIRSISRDKGERSLTVDYTWVGGMGTRWAGTQKMNPRRVVTVARQVEQPEPVLTGRYYIG